MFFVVLMCFLVFLVWFFCSLFFLILIVLLLLIIIILFLILNFDNDFKSFFVFFFGVEMVVFLLFIVFFECFNGGRFWLVCLKDWCSFFIDVVLVLNVFEGDDCEWCLISGIECVCIIIDDNFGILMWRKLFIGVLG